MRGIAGALAVAAAMVLTACSGGAAAPSTGDPAAEGDGSVAGKRVIMVHCGDINPWCAVYNKTIIDGLEAEGVTVEYLQDPFDVALQIQNLQSAIAQRPDLILLAPTDDNSVVPSLQQAKAQGIPVIVSNSRLAPGAEDLAMTVDADHGSLGKFAAQNIVEGLQARGLEEANIIALAGSDTTATSGERMKEFKAELAKYPGYKLVEERNTDWDPAAAGRIATQLFAEYESKGGIQAAYGMADYLANAVIQSAVQAGIPVGVENDGLIVTGSNCFKVGIDNIKAGLQYGTGTQTPTAEGEWVVQWALKFLADGEIPPVNLNTVHRVTAENVDEFAAECSTS
ncbi:sugar ABC transporter substrate-binding protein [Microbacterium sp. RD1]|uniref:sugar ABC transporter substrate-binding protein n=1 Tax=Microbacterium sp. RD1 TaxID=3457313 RepID=UPI003FA54B93